MYNYEILIKEATKALCETVEEIIEEIIKGDIKKWVKQV